MNSSIVAVKELALMSDNEIMDKLSEKYGDIVADTFGCCIPEGCPDEEYVSRVNDVLHHHPIGIEVVSLAFKDDDNFVWHVTPYTAA